MSLHTLFRPEAVEHRRQRLYGEVLLTLPVTHWAVTGLIAGVIAALVAALCLVSYARRQTVAGWLQPERGVVQVFAEPGHPAVVKQVLVSEGQWVQAGQPLLSLNAAAALADGSPAAAQVLEALQRERTQLEQQLATSLQQAALKEKRLHAELLALNEELRQLVEQKAGQARRVAIAQELLVQRQALLKQGFVSAADVRSTEGSMLEQQQDLATLERRRLLKLHEADTLGRDLQALPLEREAAAAALRERLAALDQRLTAQQQLGQQIITAPVAGRVGALRARAGQRVLADPSLQPPLLDLLPQGALLQAELFAPSQAMGLLKPGAPVRLRLDSYPYEKFGSLQGRVLSIAPSSSMPAELPQGPAKSGPVFRILVALPQQELALDDGSRYPLQAGMTLSADVLLEQRRLVEYWLAPLLGALRAH